MIFRRTTILLLLVSALAPLGSSAWAQHGSASQDVELVGLMEGLGHYEMKVSTTNALAQKYFNQGVRLMYGFNHDEAIRAFRAAATLDPACAMAYWGIAISLGTNYNMPMDERQGIEAYAALKRAEELADKVPPRERDYIEALSARYTYPPPAQRRSLDEAYAAAMGKLAERYPDDVDAATLYAEAMMDLRPWQLWAQDGKPEPGTEEILRTLEGVLARVPDHPGANHYYIHAVEMGVPAKGVACAERLGSITPGAGHLVHMPAHIFFRLGRYRDASESNIAAAAADEKYIAKYRPSGIYPLMYYPHNIHFLWASLAMEGRGEEAIQAATEAGSKIPDMMVKEMPMLEAFVPTRLFALVRFRKWDEVLTEVPADPQFTYAEGIRRYARGLAFAAKGQPDKATEELRSLDKIVASMPADKMAMQHKAVDLLNIAVAHLNATLMASTKQTDAALEKLRGAVAAQDALRYDEPPPWYLPMRQPLGALLLDAGRAAEAEAAYREDLQHYPENGWSLAGLERSLRAQNKAKQADEIHKRFETAWPNADIEP
jgi:tetratricopeptide (TPR) repeat protein